MCRVLGEVLPSVLTCFKPDIVLYDAGVDTHMHDSLGKLNLTDKGLQRRELQVRKAVAWAAHLDLVKLPCSICQGGAEERIPCSVQDLCGRKISSALLSLSVSA